MENNEKIEVNVAEEVVKKIEFSKGEKTALVCVATGVALIGYGVGRLIVEPVVKKAVSKTKDGVRKIFSKKEETDDLEEELDEYLDEE